MTLEFEKLTPEIDRMAQGAYQRSQKQSVTLKDALQRLHDHATDWDNLDHCVELAVERTDEKFFRAARPVDRIEPLDAAVDPPAPPPAATIVATDGSQILPDHHGAYLYALINIGVVIYYHGQGRTPATITYPQLTYPNGVESAELLDEEEFADSGAIVNIRRDLQEIQTLAASAYVLAGEEPPPWLAILDQRLLYWPTGVSGNSEGKRVLEGWQNAMASLHESGALLCGYITRPGKRSVLTMLETLDIQADGYDPKILERRAEPGEPTDAHLFRRLLAPGQRSKVFADVSQHNNDFRRRDPANEVCFFYLNPGRHGNQIARVDIPMWVAQDSAATALVHALIYDQCRIMGNYPYVLTRADEEAVVRFRDRENLEVMIANAMQRYGISREETPKQGGKDVARAGRTRHVQ
jgi:hypothetical protein